MALEVLQLSVSNTPFKIVDAETFNRELIFVLPRFNGQLFVGPDNTVNETTGFLIPFGPQPTVIPVPLDTELWAISNVAATNPLKVYVTIADSGLSNAELRAVPVLVTGTVTATPASTVLTPSAPINITIGTTSTLLVAANANRKGLYIGVLGTGNIVSLGLAGATAVANKGIVLRNAGIDVFKLDAFNFTTGQINGVANGAGTVVAIQEFT